MPPLERRRRDGCGVFLNWNISRRKSNLNGKTRPRLDWCAGDFKVKYPIAPWRLARGHAPFLTAN